MVAFVMDDHIATMAKRIALVPIQQKIIILAGPEQANSMWCGPYFTGGLVDHFLQHQNSGYKPGKKNIILCCLVYILF